MRVIVFDRWLIVSTRVARTFRVAVWRRVRLGARTNESLWSAAERAVLAREMGRVG